MPLTRDTHEHHRLPLDELGQDLGPPGGRLALALALGARFIPSDRPDTAGERFDLPGAITFTGGLVALLLGLNQGYALGWGSLPILALMVAAAVLLGVFLLVERRTPFPMLDLSLFRSRLFSAAVAAACLVLLELFIARTKLGFAIRAASFDLEAAGLMGVNVNGVVRLVFFIAGFLAGLAGVCLGMKYTVFPQLGAVTIKAFVAAVAGGLGSLPGAIIGSFALGTMETFVVAFVSSRIRDIVVFAVLIAVLLIRPSGLMGKRVEEKV